MKHETIFYDGPVVNEEILWGEKVSQTSPALQQTDFVGLSKKTINKICQSLQQFNWKDPMLISQLDGIDLIPSFALEVNNALPKIFNELCNKNNGIIEVSSDGIAHVVKMLAESISAGSLKDVVISIGMGASDEMPSVRLASYILPAIKVLKGISESELNIGLPTVRVFKATHAGVYANGMDLERVKYITTYTLAFLSGFVNQFYPELADHFVFESDMDYKVAPIYDIILDTAEKIKKLKDIDQELTTLKIMGEKHGGKDGMDKAIFYAAAHPIYNQSIISKTEENSITQFVVEHPRPKLIIDFGGRPQKTFNRVIDALRSSLNKSEYVLPALMNVIVKTGKVPVYYRARQGDILLSEVCNSFDEYVVDPMTQNDYDFIFEEIPDYEYVEYIKQFQHQNNLPI